MATTITTVSCPLCGSTIEHVEAGWFCSAAHCDFAAPTGSPDEFDLLFQAQEVPLVPTGRGSVTANGGSKVVRIVTHLVIGDTVIHDGQVRILSHDPVGIGSGIKLLRFTDGTALKVMAHDTVISTEPPCLFAYDPEDRKLYTVRDGDSYILWLTNVSRQAAVELAEHNGVDLQITEVSS